MKKYILLFFFLYSISSSSQILISLLLGDKLNSGKIEFGITGGYNWSTISGLETNKYDGSFNIGFYFDILIKDQWVFDTGVLVKSSMGVRNLTEKDLEFLEIETYDVDGNYNQILNYFWVPAMIKYKFKNHSYIEAGPQFGLMHKSWVEFVSNIDDKSVRIKEYNKDDINKFDMGINIGAGYKLLKGTGWTIGAEYYYGLLNIYKGGSGHKNSGFFVKMDIPIGLGEEAKNLKERQKQLKADRKEERKRKKQEDKKI